VTDFCCARCGSSVAIETCESCNGEQFVGHDCGEDCCSCAEPELNVECDVCNGIGHYAICLSSPEWCQANPRPGKESVCRGTVEEFEIP
jgi:hypothetical protein